MDLYALPVPVPPPTLVIAELSRIDSSLAFSSMRESISVLVNVVASLPVAVALAPDGSGAFAVVVDVVLVVVVVVDLFVDSMLVASCT